ncbi:MAG TPA: acyl-CoA thioesterase [Rhodocyclaceae bacterium]|nr:acyl-CoA thioesterase [Rhodocyclaceae bacterium]
MVFQRKKQIRFSHCDPAGIGFYPRYVALFNETVEDWFADGLGVNFFSLHDEHKLGIPTVRLEVDFKQPSRYGDILTFELRVLDMGNTSATLEIVARGEDEAIRIRGILKVVLVSLGDLRPQPWSDFWRLQFGRYLEKAAT